MMESAGKNLDIIIPAKGEGKIIMHTINQILDVFPKANLIVVDDGCLDNTTEVITAIYPKVFCYPKEKSEGKGSAIQAGWRFSERKYVAILDADLQIHPKELKTFSKIMDLYDAEVVIGNKRHLYSDVRTGILRKIISNTYNLIVRFLFETNLRDTQCGCKLFKSWAFADAMQSVTVDKFAFDLELLMVLREHKRRIVDAPVYVADGKRSGSVSIKSIWETFIDTMKVFFRLYSGGYGREVKTFGSL